MDGLIRLVINVIVLSANAQSKVTVELLNSVVDKDGLSQTEAAIGYH